MPITGASTENGPARPRVGDRAHTAAVEGAGAKAGCYGRCGMRGNRSAGASQRRGVVRNTWRQPVAWLPLASLLAVAAVAAAVQPWPEGPILLTPSGFGPHGVTFSDVLVGAFVVVAAMGWVLLLATRGNRR